MFMAERQQEALIAQDYVYKKVGVKLPRTFKAMYSTGKSVF